MRPESALIHLDCLLEHQRYPQDSEQLPSALLVQHKSMRHHLQYRLQHLVQQDTELQQGDYVLQHRSMHVYLLEHLLARLGNEQHPSNHDLRHRSIPDHFECLLECVITGRVFLQLDTEQHPNGH